MTPDLIESLRNDGLVVHETLEDFPANEAMFQFDTEAECIAAIRALCWMCTNSSSLVGHCSIPRRFKNSKAWMVVLGTTVSWEG